METNIDKEVTVETKVNISADISWLDRVIKRFKEKGKLVPDNQHKIYEKIRDHFVSGRTVIDIGCSTGIGANILSHEARHVWGIDINEEAISFANHAFARPNLSFEHLDVENFPTRPLAQFEVLTFIETLEHLANPQEGLNSVKRFFSEKLKTIGFITVPNLNNPQVYQLDATNSLHLNHWTPGEFYELMTKNFRHVVLFSSNKLDVWAQNETTDGNDTEAEIIVAKVEGAL